MKDYIITFLTAAVLLGGYWVAGIAGLAVSGIIGCAVVAAGWMTALARLDDLRDEVKVGRATRMILDTENNTLRARVRFLQSRLAAPVPPPMPECPEEDEDDEGEGEEPQGVRELEEE